MLFFDTSGLVKLVLDEVGADHALDLWNGTRDKAASDLAYPEGRAALARARRTGRLSTTEGRRALGRFERVYRDLFLVEIDRHLTRLAGDLADQHALRGYDAVHLAGALSLGPERTTVVTWDSDLALAASRSGCAVTPVS